MTRHARRLASRLLGAASRLLPPHLSPWSCAMQREFAEIARTGPALAFAAGCLRAVLALAVAAWLKAAWTRMGRLFSIATSRKGALSMTRFSPGPRALGLVCGALAVGLGALYLTAAGAPPSYIFVNLAALVLGITAWLALRPAGSGRLAGAGIVTCAFALLLGLTALFGDAADGAARWVSVGPLTLQVSLITVPPMLILYARQPDIAGTIGMIAAALGLAVQPDRAMAGVLLAGLLATALATPRLPQLAAAAASALAFGYTLLAPDRLPAVPYVDNVLYSAFEIGPFAGAAVVAGAVILLAPAWLSRTGEPIVLWVFGGCWAGMVAAAALGNYPTPLVGYGGSAVLGYLLSVALLPARSRRTSRASLPRGAEAGADCDRIVSELRGAQLA